MDKRHPYNNIIENKLQHLPGADVEQLWTGMHSILDKKMPQKKERPFFFGWFLTSKSLLLVGALPVVTLCYFSFTYFSSKKSNAIKQESVNVVSRPTSQSNDNENTATIENKEILPNTVNSVTLPANSKGERNTKIATGIVDQDAKTAERPSSFGLSSAWQNGAKSKYAIQKDHKPVNEKSADAAAKKMMPVIMNEGEYSNDAIAENKNPISTAALTTSSVDPRYRLTNPEGFLISDTAIPKMRNGLRDLLLQEVKAGKKVKLNKIDKGPYVGIMAGLDLSSVKFKSLKTGNNKGIIAGYAFNKRWSLETGLFWNKKRFFGDGTSFRPSGYTLPQGVEMLSVYGNNQLYEWPVNVRFTVLPKKHSLFVTAGLSSYFMKTESYEYEYQFNGQPGKSFSSYKNQTKDWFSVASFSLGYTHKLGNIGSVRLEPYIKLPIRDIGFNNMSVISTGFNVGFTRHILK